MLEVKDQKFQVAKGFTPNNGIYSCDPKNVVPLTGDYGSGTKCPNPAYATDPEALDLRRGLNFGLPTGLARATRSV